MNVHHTLVAAIALAAQIAITNSASSAAFVNGSFELGPSLGTAPYITLLAGSTSITGWTVGGIAIDYNGPGTWNVSDGIRNIDLDGSGIPGDEHGSISQTFDTLAGQQYVVTFDLSGNPTGMPLVKPVQVSAGATSQLFTFDIGVVAAPVLPLNVAYQTKVFSFTANSNSTTLTFASLTASTGQTGFGAIIDNVRVAVPEPSVGILLGLSAPFLLGRRRKSNKRRTMALQAFNQEIKA